MSSTRPAGTKARPPVLSGERKHTNDPTSRPCYFDVCRVGRLQRGKSVAIYAANAKASSQEDCCKKASDI
jgi:hypothetical protein